MATGAKTSWLRNPLIPVAVAGVLLVVGWYFTTSLAGGFQNFVYQADGFLHGSVFYRVLPPSLIDNSQTNGHYYWAPGPLPALVLMPLVAVGGIHSWQTVLTYFLLPLSLWLAYKLARRYKFLTGDAIWLAIAFVFGSLYLGSVVRPQAWQFSTIIATLAVLLGLYEYLTRRRLWLVGIYFACALATRVTAGLVIAVPVLDVLLNSPMPWRERWQRLVQLLWPMVVAGLGLLWLDYARTGNFLDSGYWSANINADIRPLRTQYGLFSWVNIPTNLYYYFLSPPYLVREPGTLHLVWPFLRASSSMGFFLLSPFFLYLFRAPLKQRWDKILAVVAVGMTVLLLSYYAVNVYEFGPRYLIDVLPLYYLLLLTCFTEQKLWRRDYIFILVSSLWNTYLFWSLLAAVWGWW